MDFIFNSCLNVISIQICVNWLGESSAGLYIPGGWWNYEETIKTLSWRVMTWPKMSGFQRVAEIRGFNIYEAELYRMQADIWQGGSLIHPIQLNGNDETIVFSEWMQVEN